jgi:hypothetical protein
MGEKKVEVWFPGVAKYFYVLQRIDGLLWDQKIPTFFISLSFYWLQTFYFCILNLTDANCFLSLCVCLRPSIFCSVGGYVSEQLSNDKSLDSLVWSMNIMLYICHASVSNPNILSLCTLQICQSYAGTPFSSRTVQLHPSSLSRC